MRKHQYLRTASGRRDHRSRRKAYRATFALDSAIRKGEAPGRTFEQMCNFTIDAYLDALLGPEEEL